MPGPGQWWQEWPGGPWPLRQLQPGNGPNPPIAELTDDFRSQDTAKWDYTDTGITVVNEQLRIAPTVLNDYEVLTSTYSYDLTEGWLFAEGVQMASTGASGPETTLTVRLPNGDLFYIYVGESPQQIHFVSRVGGSTSDPSPTTYSNTTHRWWRIGHSAGNILWETSLDGYAWTNRRTLAYSGSVLAVQVTIDAGFFSGSAPGTVTLFDNVNLVIAVPPVRRDIPDWMWRAPSFEPYGRIQFGVPEEEVDTPIPPLVMVPWRRDPFPQLQSRVQSPAALLDAALLEVPPPLPLQVASTFVDRRKVPQQRERESHPGLLDTAQLEVPPPLPLQVASIYADRREVPQQRVPYESIPGLLDTALLEVPPPLPDRSPVTHLRLPWLRVEPTQYDQSAAAPVDFDVTLGGYSLRPLWRRDFYPPTQRPGIQNPDDMALVGAGTSMAWWGVDDTAHHFAQWLPVFSVPEEPAGTPFDPTLGGYGPERRRWRRDPIPPQQRQLESDPTLLLTALLEVPSPLPVPPSITHQRPPWLRIKPTQYDQSSAAVIVDFDPTLAGYEVERMWWRRDPIPPQQRERESVPGLLDTALLEDVLLGGWDDLIRHRTWFTSRRLVPQQRIYFTEIPLEADPTLVGFEGVVRHRTWHISRRLVPQQRTYPDPPALGTDPLLGVGADWRRKLTAATHAPRWVLRLQIRYLEFMGRAPDALPNAYPRSGLIVVGNAYPISEGNNASGTAYPGSGGGIIGGIG